MSPRFHQPLPVLLLSVLFIAVFATSGCSPEAKKARYINRAEGYFKAGEFDKAEVEFLNALQIDNASPEALARLALIYFDQGRLGRVTPFVLRARELKPDDLEVRVKAGYLFLGGGKYDDARAEAQFVLERRPQDPDAPLILAQAAINPAELADARQRLEKLPDGSAVHVALGSLSFRQRRLEEAEAEFNRALAADAKSGDANLAMGVFLAAKGNAAEAEKYFAAAAANSPPRSPKRIQYARFKIQTGDLAGGQKVAQDLTKATPDFLPAWMLLAETAASEKKFDDAAEAVGRVLARDPAHLDARLLGSRIKLAKGEPEKAVLELEGVVKIYPRSAQVHYELGISSLAAGDVGKAASSLNQAITLASGMAEAIVVLASIDIRKGDPASAVSRLKPLVQQRPDLLQARFLLADAYRGERKLDDALAAYREIATAYPRNGQARLLMGLILLQQKKASEARQVFEKALEAVPEYHAALEQLANLDLAEKKQADAITRVRRQADRFPKVIELEILLAKVHAAANDSTKAEEALQRAIAIDPESPTPYVMLAQLYVRGNLHQKALANLNLAVQRNPKDSSALMLMAMIHDQQKEYPAARDAYEKLLVVNPRSSAALNNLSYLYSEHLNQVDKAFVLAQRARELLPHEPNTADTLGWILYKRRQYPWALSLLGESAEKLPTSAEVNYHLGMTHYMMGEEQAARLVLQRAVQLGQDFPGAEDARKRLALLETDPNTSGPEVIQNFEKIVATDKGDPVALARLARAYERNGAIDKAIATYESAVKLNPKNATVLASQARAEATRNPAKALETAKVARNLAPDDAEVAKIAGVVAFQARDYQWAASVLQTAFAGKPGDADAAFDFAKASYSIGRVAESETATRAALQGGSAFGRSAEARRMAEFIAIASKPNASAADAAAVDQALHAQPADVPALVASATIAEQKGNAALARQSYEKALALYPDFSPAKRRLAILYASDPSVTQKAVEMGNAARDAFPGDAEVAFALGVALYRQGDFTRAALLLRESTLKRAQDPEAAYYLGLALNRLGQRAESKKSLERALELKLRPDLVTEAKRVLAESSK